MLKHDHTLETSNMQLNAKEVTTVESHTCRKALQSPRSDQNYCSNYMIPASTSHWGSDQWSLPELRMREIVNLLLLLMFMAVGKPANRKIETLLYV